MSDIALPARPPPPVHRKFRATSRGTSTVVDVWIIELWHELVLVLGVAFGIAALLGLSCVAMAGIDAGDGLANTANEDADMIERANVALN